jgi:hypothetical protein
MSAGTISGNITSAIATNIPAPPTNGGPYLLGAAIYVSSSSTGSFFEKNGGGVIYGYVGGDSMSNKTENYDTGDPVPGRGHAVGVVQQNTGNPSPSPIVRAYRDDHILADEDISVDTRPYPANPVLFTGTWSY